MLSQWYKIYLFLVIAAAVSFIGVNLWAQIETDYKVKDYIKGQANCPGFVDINDLTMKDECSGLVWARQALPIFQEAADPTPGYNWQNANNACQNLEPVGMYRLPTVEELLSLVKYSCTNTACNSSLDPAIADPNVSSFSRGVYWSISDFNEPASWAADNPGRDYKRSVNLLAGRADNPIFGKETRLNAWCIVNRNPEVLEKKFISASDPVPVGEYYGLKIMGGSLKTVYNRKCTDDAGCTALLGTVCHDGYCDKIENITDLNRVISCNTGYHIEGDSCGLDTPIVAGIPSCGPSYIYNPATNECDYQAYCHNGIVDSGEACDHGVINQTANLFEGFCNTTCSDCYDADPDAYPNFIVNTAENRCDLAPWCGNLIIEGTEQCDGTTGVALTPAESSSSTQYECSSECTFTGGYNSDGIINGPEVCDKSMVAVPCETAYAYSGTGTDYTTQCSGKLIAGTKTCNDNGLEWNFCIYSLNTNDTDGPASNPTGGDGYIYSCDNCPTLYNLNQRDVDNDGIGDMCDDCYNYPPGTNSCVALKVTLTDNSGNETIWDNVKPFAMAIDPVDFYAYSNGQANITEYNILKQDRSQIFGYLYENPFKDEHKLGLMIVHDKPKQSGNDDNMGGKIKFTFDKVNTDGTPSLWETLAKIVVSDDYIDGSVHEFKKANDPQGDWTYNETKTDGGAVMMADLSSPWAIRLIEPAFGCGITEWFWVEPGAAGVNQGRTLKSGIPLNLSEDKTTCGGSSAYIPGILKIEYLGPQITL